MTTQSFTVHSIHTLFSIRGRSFSWTHIESIHPSIYLLLGFGGIRLFRVFLSSPSISRPDGYSSPSRESSHPSHLGLPGNPSMEATQKASWWNPPAVDPLRAPSRCPNPSPSSSELSHPVGKPSDKPEHLCFDLPPICSRAFKRMKWESGISLDSPFCTINLNMVKMFKSNLVKERICLHHTEMSLSNQMQQVSCSSPIREHR